MKKVTRRSFLKTTAKAAAVTIAAPVILPEGWYSLAQAEKPGYFEREFDISDGLCQKVLTEALAKGGDYADLFFEHTISNWLMLEDGKVNRAYSDVSLGTGIRTVKGDQVGYGFTQELTKESMMNAAATAATIASGSAAKPAGKFTWLKTKNY
jgi:TldD protein